jgi:hypothetical protein
MKTIHDKATRDELIVRIIALNENSKAQWGKMDVGQMMKHCTQWEELALGKQHYKQSFLGKLFGKIALKDILKDVPMKKNVPTVPSFKIKTKVDVAEEKKKWVALLKEYDNYSNDGFFHPFFGKVTKEQAGFMGYKHIDHHLRQFNA